MPKVEKVRRGPRDGQWGEPYPPAAALVSTARRARDTVVETASTVADTVVETASIVAAVARLPFEVLMAMIAC
jgi:hypothetical protein